MTDHIEGEGRAEVAEGHQQFGALSRGPRLAPQCGHVGICTTTIHRSSLIAHRSQGPRRAMQVVPAGAVLPAVVAVAAVAGAAAVELLALPWALVVLPSSACVNCTASEPPHMAQSPQVQPLSQSQQWSGQHRWVAHVWHSGPDAAAVPAVPALVDVLVTACGTVIGQSRGHARWTRKHFTSELLPDAGWAAEGAAPKVNETRPSRASNLPNPSSSET